MSEPVSADLIRRLRQHDGHLGHLVEEAADALEALAAAYQQGREDAAKIAEKLKYPSMDFETHEFESGWEVAVSEIAAAIRSTP